MPAKRYVEVNLETACETLKPEPAPERGERYHPISGKLITALPGDTVDCPGEADEKYGHHADCVCHGTGLLPIRRPLDEPITAADDSLTALEDAIAQRESDGSQVDPFLGASIASLMKRQVQLGGSSGSGGRKRKPDVRRATKFDPHPGMIDGRLERRGRPPRFGEVRNARVRTTIAPETQSILEAAGDDLANVIETILADPDSAAILEEFRLAAACKKKTSVETSEGFRNGLDQGHKI